MDEAFIIMQIGDSQLERVCDEVFIPAIELANLAPRRVDRHNTGDLLKSEVVQFIERSQIIVADVTNERPNCYLEIGYAMGLNKKANLILTAREDHHHNSPNFNQSGPKIHFDLEGYDILFWDSNNLTDFKSELTKRIQRRVAIVKSSLPSSAQLELENTNWTSPLHKEALRGLNSLGKKAFMEISASVQPRGNWSQTTLRESIEASTISTFGWPIGLVLSNRDEFRPRPVPDGIITEIKIEPESSNLDRASYDYWKLFRDGRFYTLLSLFEDEQAKDVIFFDVRLTRITESLLLLARLYRRLGVSDNDVINVEICHSGLKDRSLQAAGPMRRMHTIRRSTTNKAKSSIRCTLSELEANLSDYVKQLANPLFILFDFFEVNDEVAEKIIDSFVEGKIV